MVPIEIQELQDELDDERYRVTKLKRAIKKALTANTLDAALFVLAAALREN